MRWVAVGALMALVGLPALWARNDVKDKPKEPEKSKVAEEVNAVLMAHQKAVNDYYKNIQEKLKNAKTDEERSKIYEGIPKPDETMAKLWDLVEKNPNEKDATRTALQWLLSNYGYDDKGQKGRDKVLDMLIRYHADDPKIGPVLNRLSNVPSAKAEELLRAVLAKNPSKGAKGVACLDLGKYLKNSAELVQQLKANPEEGKQLEGFLGKETVMKLKETDAAKLAKEAEAAFEEADSKYGDVVLGKDRNTMKNITIADQVAGELFEIRNLAIGKTAPDIAADDLDGKSFKLSDYRGKVVVIDFWGNW
jgi:tetratricopeptide (TPR) repeat protein